MLCCCVGGSGCGENRKREPARPRSACHVYGRIVELGTNYRNFQDFHKVAFQVSCVEFQCHPTAVLRTPWNPPRTAAVVVVVDDPILSSCTYAYALLRVLAAER